MQEAKIKEFQEQYRDLKTAFMRYAQSMLKDQALAEEVVHEAFLSAFSHWDSFQGNSKRSTWLWSILRNECLGYLRKAELKYEKKGDAELEHLASSEESADILLIKNAESKKIDEALESLSLKQREILELRLSDLSLEEISTLLSLPVSTVKSHIHRAKKQLIQYLQEAKS